VGRHQGIGDPERPVEELPELQAVTPEKLRESATIHKLHGEEDDPFHLLHRMQRDDVGVVEGRDGPRLALEARAAPGVDRYLGGKGLERDAAPQAGILGQVHDPHPTLPDLALDAVVGDRLSRFQGHAVAPTSNGDPSDDAGAVIIRSPCPRMSPGSGEYSRAVGLFQS
jgi:hypothetical protein